MKLNTFINQQGIIALAPALPTAPKFVLCCVLLFVVSLSLPAQQAPIQLDILKADLDQWVADQTTVLS